ncbi:MAG: photosystem II stability/assembly factor-like protein [Gammaproteobacteria bacterium]
MNRTTSIARAARVLPAIVFGLVLGSPLAAQEPADAEAAIEIIHQGIPHDALYALDMSGERGLAVGNFGLMLETTDGGRSWKLLEPVTTLALLGAATAGQRQLVVGQQGFAMVREQGGEWTTIDTGLTERLLNVDMNESGLAIAVGEFGFIGRSRDFGATWESIAVDWAEHNEEGYEPHLYGSLVLEDGTIMITGEFGLILRSNDGGDTFTAVNRGEASVFDVFLARDGSNVGYAVGQEGLVLRTGDRGDSWQQLDVDTDANLLGVWTGNGEVVITGIRAMLRSSDDGATFTGTEDINVIRTWFQGVAAGVAETQTGEKGFLREQSVYTVGNRGTIARILR